MTQKLSLHALNRVLASIDAPRNGRALYALLSAFCLAGLMLASAESALAKTDTTWGVIWAGLGLVTAFLGVNTTGLLLMDQARGRPVRDVVDAFHDALRVAPKVLLSLLMMLSLMALALGALVALLWAVKLPWIGTPLFALMVPLCVALLGVMAFSGAVIVGPLTGPSMWSGRSALGTARLLLKQLRHGALEAGALMMAVLLTTGLVSAAVSFVVVSGGRALAFLMVWLIGIDVPAQQLMAGLFGYGLRSLGATGAPVAATPLGMATLIGGGVVFAIALVLPTLVYLRGCCAVFLALQDAPADDAAL
ncbi:hypothetical protein LNV08_17635 [Paucibacter sp. TC2R-5]|uniref:hypothetical protein n=1 Tax=Paucibacter sp. TC2R-5 TaxID=2893555 RepID=UPI0021E4690E|nr:hypothetical protein [Paucibacter sp. TC2R-5]MCV2360798.1 hypothetical protein [Paucibacter sp. TC2R-5]